MWENPIKRNQHISRLSKDHHFTLLFSWKIRQGLRNGVDIERIKKYVHYFWHHDMQSHFREEDEILFACLKDEKVQKAMEEHQQIKMQVGEVLKTLEKEEASGQLAILADTIDDHVRYEERVLFPHLEKNLTTFQLESIGGKLKKQPTLLDIYEDEFWIRNPKH